MWNQDSEIVFCQEKTFQAAIILKMYVPVAAKYHMTSTCSTKSVESKFLLQILSFNFIVF